MPSADRTPHADRPSQAVFPEPLRGVALLDAKSCAAIGAMKLSWWYAQVKAGRAPQPVVRAPRCSRWRLVDVENFWRAFAAGAAVDEAVIDRATAASRRSQAKRLASQQAGQGA